MEKMQMRKALGAEIRGEIAAQGLSKEQLSEAAGMDRTTLWRYIKGERAMPMDALFAVADALRVPAGQLVQRAEERAHRDSE